MEATILRADLDAFFASVEQRDDPRLRSRAVIVGAGVVMAASYEARACGVRSAMGGTRARRLCPQAVVVAPRWQAYLAASRAVFAIIDDTAPLVERVSIDEAFLDVRGLHAIAGSPRQIVNALRRAVREQVGPPISIGVATTKVLAKVASAMAKPDGLLSQQSQSRTEHPQELNASEPQVAHAELIGAQVMRELVAHGARHLGAQQVRIVAEVAPQGVAVDHDPVGHVVARDAVAVVEPVGARPVPAV